MKYSLPTKLTGYYPEALATLINIDDTRVYSEDINLSHPSDIFLLTFSDVIDCAFRLAKRANIETIQRRESHQYTHEDLNEIRFDILNLTFFAANFIEACQSIIKSLFPSDEQKNNFTKAAREFKDMTKDYRRHVSNMINQIKHKHRRIRTFTYTWDNNIILGYFVEGLVGKDILGPDPEIHSEFNGLKTGFSINRDLPYHLVNLYFVSACLNSIVTKYSKINKTEAKVLDGTDITRCLVEVSSLPSIFFPDEIRKDVPAVHAKDRNRLFILELPSKRLINNKALHLATISVTSRIGLRNRSLVPPYFRVVKNG